jgi:O-antigen/teichoic acid export membrane protein
MFAAQVAAFAATPLLTRLYSPAQFGVYALFLSLLSTFAPIAALRFDAALPLATDDDEASAILRAGLAATLVMGLLALLATGLPLDVWWRGDAATGDVAIAMKWLPLGLLLTGAFQVGAAWRVRANRADRAALGRAAQGLGAATGQATLGLVGSTVPGLPLGDVIGRALSCLIVLPAPTQLWGGPRTHGLLDTARRYRGFATLASVAALLNAANSALPVFVIGSSLGTASTGLLLLAQRVASLPSTLLATAVSQVFAVQLARTPGGPARVALLDATLRDVLRTAIVPAAAIAALSPFAFAPAFGAEWRAAGTIATALVPFYLAQVLSASTITAVDVLQLHGERMLRELIFFAGSLSVLGAGLALGWSLPGVVAAFSAFGAVFYGGSLWWIRRRLARGDA